MSSPRAMAPPACRRGTRPIDLRDCGGGCAAIYQCAAAWPDPSQRCAAALGDRAQLALHCRRRLRHSELRHDEHGDDIRAVSHGRLRSIATAFSPHGSGTPHRKRGIRRLRGSARLATTPTDPILRSRRFLLALKLHVWYPNPQEQPQDRLLLIRFQRTDSRRLVEVPVTSVQPVITCG